MKEQPHRPVKRVKQARNAADGKSETSSRCTALVLKHTNMQI